MTNITEKRTSPVWLNTVLRANTISNKASVISVESEPLTGGLMAETLALSLSYEGGDGSEPTAIVAKLPSSNPDSAAVGMEVGAYAREVNFYQKIARRLTLRVPKCYYAEMDAASGDFALLLEDARPAVVPTAEIEGCYEVAKLAIVELARLHAGTWADTSFKTLPVMPIAAEAPYQSMVLDYASKGWEIFKPLVQDLVSSEQSNQIEKILAGAGQWMKSGEQANCLIHGDFRFGNLLFTADGEVVTLDWQTYQWGNPGSDLAHFLLMSLAPDQQASWSKELLDLYLNQISSCGVNGYEETRLAYDYQIGILNEVVMIMMTVYGVGANGLSDQARDQMRGGLSMVLPAITRYKVMDIVDAIA